MKSNPQITGTEIPAAQSPSIKIFGVGNAGVTLLESLKTGEFAGASLIAVNTDAPSLNASSVSTRIHLETRLMRGLGSGGDPDRGRALAEEQFVTFKAACEGADVVLIIAGLGGGAGTGISPVLARAAREAGALTIGFVTLPFLCEGNRRQQLARQGADELKAVADGLVCLPNQKLFKLIEENTSVIDTFRLSGELLLQSAGGLWRLLTRPGLIQIHFNDICALLRDRHSDCVFAVVEACGAARSREIVEKLVAHPLLDQGRALAESETLLISLVGGSDLSMAEVNRVMEQISRHSERAQVMMGATVDDSFKGRFVATVIVARQAPPADAAPAMDARAAAEENISEQLVARKSSGRPASRCVPPPPTLTPEQRDQVIKQHPGGRSHKRKMLQAQLPLAIISKGRFDKSEPTIHKGEDLDLPTYVRRGIALN